MKNDIKGIVVLKGTIELQSPMLIGSGDNENSDIDVLLDVTGKPFIPATSFVGVLKSHLKSIELTKKDDCDRFWGYSVGENSRQSNLNCSDLLPVNDHKITIRDGIEINRLNGMVKSGGKYDFEIVERGSQFSLELNADYNESNELFIKEMFETIKYELVNSKVRVGAKTQSGLGKIILKDACLFEYKFSEPKDVIKYFKNERGSNFSSKGKFDIKSKVFVIDAWFDLKTSLISRSYSSDPKESDSTHIRSLDDYILTGTGLKGAISSRAEKILNTIFVDGKKTKTLYNELFGFVKKKEELEFPDDPIAKRSRVRIKETILPKEKFIAEQQTRIKIDRFTGGTIKSALFDSMPLFRKNKTAPEKVINIKISIKDWEDYEAGLMLLVLKDLWTADLPIGGEKNIGRGVLEGVYAQIIDGNGESIEITDPGKLKQDKKDKLQAFVDALNNCEVTNE